MWKVAVFFLIFAVIIPGWSVLAAASPRWRTAAFIGMLFFTCGLVMINIDPLPDWRGTARGYALTMVDIFSSIVFLSIYLDRKCKKVFFPPGSWTYGLYFFFVILSGVNAVFLQQWGFEIVKMFWMYVFFVAGYNYLVNYRNLWPTVYAICGVLLLMFLVGFYQKYIAGSHFQIPSTMPHQNSMSLYVELFGCIILGVLLNEKLKLWQMALLSAGFLSALMLMIFSYSRGGLFCFMFAVVLLLAGSVILGGFNLQKLTFILLGTVVGAALVAYAAPRIIQRFQNAPEASKNTRIFLAYAAARMANDYKLGVGANLFSAYSGPTGKYSTELYETTRITEETPPYGPIVETIYLLVAAECGWLGLVSLIIWFGYYLVVAWQNTIFFRHGDFFGISLGTVCGLFANYLQSVIEWSLKQYNNFYQLMFVFALTAAIYAYRKRAGRRPQQ